MATQTLERDTRALDFDQPAVQPVLAETSSDLAWVGQSEEARPGALGSFFGKLFSVLLLLGRTSICWPAGTPFNQEGGLSQRERDWLELYMRYDLHL